VTAESRTSCICASKEHKTVSDHYKVLPEALRQPVPGGRVQMDTMKIARPLSVRPRRLLSAFSCVDLF
jgi:hypothetical protein